MTNSRTCPRCERPGALALTSRLYGQRVRYCWWAAPSRGMCDYTRAAAEAAHIRSSPVRVVHPRPRPPVSNYGTRLPSLPESAQAGDYIRAYYGLTCQVGDPIRYEGQPGRITGFRGAHLVARLDGKDGSVYLHPTWHVEYPVPS